MASNINTVTLGGRLTRDPELKATNSGVSILEFGLASNTSRKNQAGQWEDVAGFYDCKVIGSRADSLARILRKGMPVVIAGRLSYSQWEKDGQKRSKVEIVADSVELPPKQDGHQAQPAQQANQGLTYDGAPLDFYEEDIPF